MKIRALLSVLLPLLLSRVLCKKDEANGTYGNHGGEEIIINRRKDHINDLSVIRNDNIKIDMK